MDVLFVASPTAYRAFRDGAAIMAPSMPLTTHVNDVVAIGEPWALRQGSMLMLEYRHTAQAYFVVDEALIADAASWILPEGHWHTAMPPWAVRRWGRVMDVYHNASDGSLAALIKQTVVPS